LAQAVGLNRRLAAPVRSGSRRGGFSLKIIFCFIIFVFLLLFLVTTAAKTIFLAAVTNVPVANRTRLQAGRAEFFAASTAVAQTFAAKRLVAFMACQRTAVAQHGVTATAEIAVILIDGAAARGARIAIPLVFCGALDYVA
jgi:hypothetical protein